MNNTPHFANCQYILQTFFTFCIAIFRKMSIINIKGV
nr:MAG TPA: hypothetical protein [Caudoviricetes sp.]DAV92639.1 MAG TPA: hypothetical protein [Caudoviricetes sp.]